ncbi:MAG: FG-GAP-like repeat-containing protein, partial [Verrucomicrobiota bacterium]
MKQSWGWLYTAACFFAFLLASSSAFSQNTDRYLEWARAQFGEVVVADSRLEATIWGPNANPDGDAFVNLLEYTLGFDADVHSPVPANWFEIKTAADGKEHVFLNVSHRHDDPDLLVLPQVSSDCKLWSPSPPANLEAWLGDVSPIVPAGSNQISSEFTESSWYDPVSVDADDSRFMRIYVERFGANAFTSAIEPFGLTQSDNAPLDSIIQSNPIVLRGFAGSVQMLVGGGLRFIVNGEDRGNNTFGRAGDVVVVEADTGIEENLARNIRVVIGDFEQHWRFTTGFAEPLPDHTGTVSGYSPVEVNVNEGGAAQISHPIVCSPGTGGMQPELAVSYSSQGGNGMMGVGFNLSGLSQITRSPQTIAQDGNKGGIGLNLDDRFSLDGQRLIAINGADGGDGTEYRTEVDSYSKVLSQLVSGNGPGRFRVQTKSGLEYRYGFLSNARVFPEDSATPLSWALNRVTDTVGNYFDVTYDDDARLRGEWLPTQIVYTSNDAAGLTGLQTIDLSYEDRPDTSVSYVAGYAVHRLKRLSRIECKHDGNLVRRYDFAYENVGPARISRLISITETGSDGSAFPPTLFEWGSNGDPDYEVSNDTIPQAWPNAVPFDRSPPAQMVIGDFNADGLQDNIKMNDHGTRRPRDQWLALGQRDGTLDFHDAIPGLEGRKMSSSDVYSRLRTGDFNADGRTDLLHLYFNSASNWMALAQPNGTFVVREGVDQLGDLDGQTFQANSNSELLTVDVTGDGRTDVVYLERGKHAVHICQPDGSFVKVADPGLGSLRIDEGAEGFGYTVPGDYNGDGLADILYFYLFEDNANPPRQTWLAMSNGDGTFSVKTEDELPSIADLEFDARDSWMMNGDYNGDGLTDIYCVIPNASARDNWLAFSKGDGSFDVIERPTGLEEPPLSVRTHSHIISGDFNGDGLTDLFHAERGTPSRHWLAYSRGDGSFTYLQYADLGPLQDRKYRHPLESRFFPIDSDGDGRSDLVHLDYFTTDGYHLRSTGYDLHKITKVTNGHGRQTNLTYKTLTDPAIYTKGTSAVYPCHDFVAPIYVVSDISTNNGIGGTNQISYVYEEAWMCLDGRGFRGFKCIQTTDHTNSIVTRTKYDERPLAAGRPVQSQQLLADGRFISESESVWEIAANNHPTGNTTYEVRNTQTIAKEYE